MHDIDQTRWKIHFSKYFAELHSVVRRLLAWLDHDRVSGNQRRARLPRNKEEGKVPRQNSADHANRPSKQEDGLAGPVALNNLALDTAAPLRHVLQVVRGELDFNARQAQRLALFLGNHAGNRFHILANLRCQRLKQFGAACGGLLLPRPLRRFTRRDCRIHILLGTVWNRTNYGACRRVLYLDTTAIGGNEFAIDEVFKVFHRHSPARLLCTRIKNCCLTFLLLGEFRSGPRDLPRAIARKHHPAVWFASRVDPDHRHLSVRSIHKPMRKPAGNKRRIAIAQFVLPALNHADSFPLHNSDRLVKIVNVTGKRCARKKPAVPAANSLRAITASEEIAKKGICRQLIDGAAVVPNDRLGIRFGRKAKIPVLHRERTIYECSRRTRRRKGPMRHKRLVRTVVLNLVYKSRRDVHAIPRTQSIQPSLQEHAGAAFDHRDGFAEFMQMVGQIGHGCECCGSGTESRRPASFRDKRPQFDTGRRLLDWLGMAGGGGRPRPQTPAPGSRLL